MEKMLPDDYYELSLSRKLFIVWVKTKMLERDLDQVKHDKEKRIDVIKQINFLMKETFRLHLEIDDKIKRNEGEKITYIESL